MIKPLFISGVLLLLAGCASFPESVQLPPDSPTITYEQAAMDIEGNKGQLAQWGGVIASIENLSDKTKLEVVYHPLRNYGRPLLNKESVGRFRVYVDGFLDPMVYQRGRTVTFSGALTALEQGMVGEHKYFYPTLAAKGYHLWEDVERIEVSTMPLWPMHLRGGWRILGMVDGMAIGPCIPKAAPLFVANAIIIISTVIRPHYPATLSLAGATARVMAATLNRKT